MSDGGWLENLLAVAWEEDGEEHSPQRRRVDLIGASIEEDAVNRKTVIRIGSTADWKGSVRVATVEDMAAVRVGNTLTASANGSINAAGIDGVTDLALDELMLFKDEAAKADRGIYKLTDLGSASSPWVAERADLASSSKEVTTGLTTYVEEGSVNARTVWRLTTPMPISLNVTELVFESTPVTPHADVSSGFYTANIAQRVILCDSTGGGFTIGLPEASTWKGGFFWVKDVGGAAGSNNILIQHFGGTIEGAGTLTININRRAFALYSDGGTDLRIMSTS